MHLPAEARSRCGCRCSRRRGNRKTDRRRGRHARRSPTATRRKHPRFPPTFLRDHEFLAVNRLNFDRESQRQERALLRILRRVPLHDPPQARGVDAARSRQLTGECLGEGAEHDQDAATPDAEQRALSFSADWMWFHHATRVGRRGDIRYPDVTSHPAGVGAPARQVQCRCGCTCHRAPAGTSRNGKRSPGPQARLAWPQPSPKKPRSTGCISMACSLAICS